ncbi:unnamed protein product [Protopolystoma xenopodis]|uniref:Uncharacterized protein n=1 Tax=Protopolystoma xenopodis TaxID=117903 RepID=A0A448XKC9_9PLAT|nr:unnamed protein product [Protopolystoma xenopodis]
MARLTDDADYIVGELSVNVPNPRSDTGKYGNYYIRELRARYVQLSSPESFAKLRKRDHTTSIHRMDTAIKIETTTSGSIEITF